MSIESIYPDIMPHINSYINVVDIIEFWSNLDNCNKEGKLALPVQQGDILELLEKIQYRDLLKYIIDHIQLDDTVKPVFLSVYNDEIWNLMKYKINVDRNKTKIILIRSEKRYVIETTFFMSEVLYAVLSQIHAFLVLTVEQFQTRKDLLSSYNVEFFSNAKGAFSIMNFIQEWCYEKLGFKKKIQNGIFV